MSKKPKKYVVLKVITESTYIFEKGSIDGRDTQSVINEWFHRYPLGTTHAARESRKVSGSTKLISVEVIQDDNS